MEKHPTGITGFDHITEGGLPTGRSTLIAGSAGCGKTVLAVQFLVAGIEQFGQPGVLVTFEETPDDIRANVAAFGWPIDEYERDGLFTFVDASPEPTATGTVIGDFDFNGLLARVGHAVSKTGATRLSIDSLGSMFERYDSGAMARREMLRIAGRVKQMGVTSLITAERLDEHGRVARFGVEEFVTDNVIVLRNTLTAERRRRTIEILKMRGAGHRTGEFPFTLIGGDDTVADRGVVVIPLSVMQLDHDSTTVRISSGSAELDEMCGGGFYRDSVVLVSGATGTGKTLMATEFAAGGAAVGDRCLLFAFEESHPQLIRNASSWGIDIESYERDGTLQIVSRYPESDSLEDHLVAIKAAVDSFRPDRIAIDSLSALDRMSNERGFREFAISLTSFLKERKIASLLTTTTPSLLGGDSVTDAHVSTTTDSIILLRYVEVDGQMRRAITVLKMRGSKHDRSIREFSIDDSGMRIGDPFQKFTGIISGHVGPPNDPGSS
ncbi:MAG: circadian clock protein KaiC [Ilumatobacteraceae bacterium]